MSIVQLLGVNVTNNPARFSDKYVFEITFECVEQLEKDLEWKLTYVGSAQSNNYDQELDSLLVGPIPVGVNKFVFEADAPDLTRIPTDELLGVTVILLTCAYDGREFVRVGYYVNNEYDDEALINDPPAKPVIEKIRRNVLAEKPRVTRFAIKWDSEATAPAEFPPEQPEADLAEPDEDKYGADELAEEEAEAAEVDGAAKKEGDDDVMGGVEGAAAAAHPEAETGANADEDEISEEGSVDLDDSEEDPIEEEEEEAEAGAEAGQGEAMEVDDKPATASPAKVAAH